MYRAIHFAKNELIRIYKHINGPLHLLMKVMWTVYNLHETFILRRLNVNIIQHFLHHVREWPRPIQLSITTVK